MLSRLVCFWNSGAKGTRKSARSGQGSDEALGLGSCSCFHSTTETPKGVLGSASVVLLDDRSVCML
jgi:hypothetical protein